MDFDKLKKNVNDANEIKDIIAKKKAEEEQRKIDEYKAKIKIFEIIEKEQREFIDLINNISDEKLQAFFEDYFNNIEREYQECYNIVLKFFLNTPELKICFKQKEDLKKAREVYDEYFANKGEFKDFEEYLKAYEDNDSVFKMLFYNISMKGYYALQCWRIWANLNIPDFNYEETLQFCTDHIAGIDDDTDRNKYLSIEKIISVLLFKYLRTNTLDSNKFSWWSDFEAEIFGFINSREFNLEIKNAIVNRLEKFDLSVIDSQLTDDDGNIEIEITIRNPLRGALI